MSINTIIKQHAGAINKLSLAVYNIDESLFNQIFNKQEQGEASKEENAKENNEETKETQ